MLLGRGMYIVIAILFAAGLGIIAYVFWGKEFMTAGDAKDDSCIKSVLSEINRDPYLPGVLELNEKFKVLMGYYDCNKVKRNDLAWFRVAKPIPPVPRVIKGLPGDRFDVVKDPTDENRWHLKINDRYVETNGQRYYIQMNKKPPLKTYQESRRGQLRSTDYIVLGTKSPSMSDSSSFGLVGIHQLEGLVKKVADE